MKSKVKQVPDGFLTIPEISLNYGIPQTTIKFRIKKRNVQYVHIGERLKAFDAIGVAKIIELEPSMRSKRARLRKSIRHNEKVSLKKFFALELVATVPYIGAKALAELMTLPIDEAKRICQTKDVVAQSKINFGIV